MSREVSRAPVHCLPSAVPKVVCCASYMSSVTDAASPVVVDAAPVVVEAVPMAADRASRGSASSAAMSGAPFGSQRGSGGADPSKPGGGLTTSGSSRFDFSKIQNPCDLFKQMSKRCKMLCSLCSCLSFVLVAFAFCWVSIWPGCSCPRSVYSVLEAPADPNRYTGGGSHTGGSTQRDECHCEGSIFTCKWDCNGECFAWGESRECEYGSGS